MTVLGEQAQPNEVLVKTSPILETLGVSRVQSVAGKMTTTVSNVNVRVASGEFAMIFGRSGAGKSTLLHMMIGLESPDVGEVFLKGSTLYGYDEEQRSTIRRRRLGHILQTNCWIDDMSLQVNVALPLLLNGSRHDVAMERSAEMLREVGLYERLRSKPHELSIGEQQIAATARALVKNPWICFADEPTAHLDTKAARDVSEILLNASRLLGVTIVMVTHDLSLLPVADRWLFMQDGRLWNIDDHDKPFEDIRDAVAFVESFGRSAT